jgi:hypothetical protein
MKNREAILEQTVEQLERMNQALAELRRECIKVTKVTADAISGWQRGA